MTRHLYAAAVITALVLSSPSLSRSAPALTGHPAPRFTLPARSGAASLDSLRGKVVLVDFWASWCGPCRASFPWLGSMQERYGPRGLAVVAVNLDKERADADAFLERYATPFTVAFDPTGKTAEAYAVAAMPSTFLLDRDGKVLLVHTGFDARKTATFEDAIRKAVQ
jgi:cytochrome c biogenesis protein CcmG, thiol:disulfide interchange protein DsbE